MKSTLKKVTILLGAGFLFACSKSNVSNHSVSTPKVTGPVIESGAIPEGTGKPVTLSNGSEIIVHKRGGKLFFQAEGTLATSSFTQIYSRIALKPEQEKKAILSQELNKVLKDLKKAHAVEIYEAPEVGYFLVEVPYEPELMSPLKSIRSQHAVLIEPVLYQPKILDSLKEMNPAAEGFVAKPRSGRGRDGRAALSGLERIHAPEFVKQAETDIGDGIKVNGSSVKVGITDTGITFNHPTFKSADGSSNRVFYMKDFTREGRVYFNKKAKFEVSVPAGGAEEDLLVNAQVILTPRLPSVPAGDILVDVADLKMKVSSELKEILTKPGSGAKLGILDEDSFQAASDAVDLNGDGSTDGKIFLILVPGATPAEDKVYVDPSGTADFRHAQAIGDWNKTKKTVQAFSERFGFDFRDDVLPSAFSFEKVPVRSVSIVGFDPGAHGTHVAGIIGGRRTIDNDDASTLARGVAPDAQIGMNRVCANNGGCAATQAFVDLALNAGVDVINMSLGGLNVLNDGFGVQETVINRLTTLQNVLFVISAGNSGPGRQTVGSPSTASLALSVGASATRAMIQRQYQWPGGGSDTDAQTDDDDFMLFFSSRGPTANGGFKPNLTAPGTELSSVPLNAAPGVRGGLDVYWGTSMSAPTATGAYALLLDGINKYNLKNPSAKLPTNAMKLRDVLIQTARPFDVAKFDPATGERTQGQYTWVDQGTGMLDLTAAWKKLFELRDQAVASAVKLRGESVDLEYQVVVPLISPMGIPYDGSRPAGPGTPAFGTGVYLSFNGTENLRQVSIIRKLPETLAASPDAGDLMAQLRTTEDEFVLKTLIYGSDLPWIKAGAMDALGCNDSEVSNLLVVGEGAAIDVSTDGSGHLNPSGLSTLNLCINREMMKQLPPGDHGALVSGYRVVNGSVSKLASFIVPVYVTVPNHVLAHSTGYGVQNTVRSFSVKRNYVNIPKGTTLVRVSLEVPELKVDADGNPARGEACSGVELMALIGTNVSRPFNSRAEARVTNCDNLGRPNAGAKRKLSLTVINPTPGMWDLPVFGLYKFVKSRYHLKVDYLNASSNVSEIKGGLDALKGSLKLTFKETSLDLAPTEAQSVFQIGSLVNSTPGTVQTGQHVFVSSPLGALRSYPAGVKKVHLSLSGSTGNDLDLFVLECPKTVTDPQDPLCAQIASSDGPTDEEEVSFEPKADQVYAVRVDGATVHDDGSFVSLEALEFAPEKGSVAVRGTSGEFDISYSMTDEQLASSPIATHDLFKSGKYSILGSMVLSATDQTVLYALPVKISSKPEATLVSLMPVANPVASPTAN